MNPSFPFGEGFLDDRSIASIIAVVMAGVLFVLSIASIYSNTFAWWDRSSGQVTGFDDPDGTEHHWFTILLPCRKEPEAVMRATLDRLLSQSHRRLDVIISTGHDDPETIAIAERLAAEHPGRVSVSVDHSVPKNKPKQMNTALGMCRGEIVGIFDGFRHLHRRGSFRLAPPRPRWRRCSHNPGSTAATASPRTSPTSGPPGPRRRTPDRCWLPSGTRGSAP